GINITSAATFASISSVVVRDTRIESCSGGGMSWQGQILTLDNVTFANCAVCAFTIPYNSVHCHSVYARSLYFENNKADINIEALLSGRFENLQITHNNTSGSTLY